MALTKITSDVIGSGAIESGHIASGAISSGHLTGITTDNVSEGSSNTYFTNARARGSVSVTGSGLSYDSSTGVIQIGSIPNSTLTNSSLTVNSNSVSLGGSVTLDTDDIGEGGSNLYFTNARAQGAISGGTGVTVSGGAISIGQDVATSSTPTFGNITTTGYIAGPATFTIDPAAVGDNTGTLVIAGNLQVDGTTTTINSTTMTVDDLNITLASGAANAAAANGAGITVDGASATITYDGTNDEWDFNKPINIRVPNSDTLQTAIFTRQNNAAGTDGNSFVLRNDAVNNFVEMNSGGTNNGGFKFYRGSFSGDPALTIVGAGTNGGNVGIGTTSPTEKLNVNGNSLINGIAAINKTAVASAVALTINSDVSSTTSYGLEVCNATSNTRFLVDGVGNSSFYGSDNSLTARFSSDNKVGIGTDNPDLKLHVSDDAAVSRVLIDNTSNAAAGSGIYLRTLSSGTMVSNATVRTGNNGDFSIWTGTTGEGQRLTIDGSGNVGIGTTDPNGKLHVSGGRAGVISTDSSWGQFRVGNTGDGEVGIAYVTGAVEADFLHDTDPGCAYKVIMGINPYGAGTRNFGIGNDTMASYHTIWTEAGHQLPRINNTFDLGSGAQSFRNIHTDNIGVGRGDGPFKKLDVRLSTATAGSHIAAHIGGNNHAAGYAVGLGFDPEGYGYRNKMAIFAEGTGLGYSRGRLHFALRGGSNSDEVAITDSKMCILENGNIGIGPQIDAPAQLLTVATTTNYDPPGLGNSNATFSVLKKDGSASGNYGMITGISNDGNVWSQVQRVDGTATAYNYYLQPDGGSVGIGIPQNHPYIPNLLYPLRVGKTRTGTGNVTDYLSKIAIDGLGYGGSNYQMAAIDFTGGDTAGKSGNIYGRIGCSSMVGTNNQEAGSLEFYAAAPGFAPTGSTHAMKIHGRVLSASAGNGTTRNGVLFTYQGLAIDRSWADYPSINVMNSTPYSTNVSTQSELRIHGNNVSSASYPGTSGSDFSCTVRADGGYVTGSDRRRKRNITTIDNALDTVKQLTGKRFQTVNRVEQVQENVSKNGYKLGFIAQEVEDIIPEAVQYHADEDDGTENWNSSYAMDYGSVVALLVNAIKEQDTVIEDLKSRIETLEE